MSTDTVFSVGSEDCRFVCCILPTAFVTVRSWVERKWNVSVICRVFLPRHVDRKGAVQPVAPQQLLWLWALWVLLWWVLLLLLRVQLLWPPGPDCRRLSSGLHHRHKWHLLGKQQNRGACLKHCSHRNHRLLRQ